MTAPAATKTSEYVVLERREADVWELHGTFQGANQNAAIRAYLSDGRPSSPVPIEYVAIPARSWKPVTVKTETKTVVTLSTD